MQEYTVTGNKYLVADSGQLRKRFQQLRKALDLTQQEVAVALELGRGSTVSDWERGVYEIGLGELRRLADFCVNDREMYQWLREGGPMPLPVRILPGVAPEAAWEGERREVARWLREKADQLDPPERPATPAVSIEVVTRGAKAVATAKPGESGPTRRQEKAE